MEEVVKMIFNEKIDANIFDEDIDFKIAKIIKEANLEFDKDLYYRIEVVFDLKCYEDKNRLHSFILKNDKSLQRVKNDNDLINEILSQQLSNIQDALSFIDISSSIIKGDEVNDLNSVTIEIIKDKSKKYNKKGELIKEIKCSSIMPSYPGFVKNYTEACAKMIQDYYDNEARKEKELKEHIPNYIPKEVLFEKIAEGLAADIKAKTNQEKAITNYKQQLIESFNVISTYPLELAGDYNKKSNSEVKQFDCPEILIYKEFTNGRWIITRIEYFKDAEDEITKNGYCKKDIKSVVILKDLKPLSFMLINKEYVGMKIVTKEDAKNYKKLDICWK